MIDRSALNTQTLRFGFAVKVLGQPDLKSNDTRRWQSGPHLRISLGYLRDIFAYLDKHNITMYRMSSDIAPYVTHPDLPQFHNQIEECSRELRELGQQAKAQGLRLSFHPSQFVILNSPDRSLVDKSIWDLEAQAELLDRMELGPEAVLVIHVGGTYGDRQSGCRRWIETYNRLPEAVRRRLVLENDDIRYSAANVLAIHEQTGVPLIFDYQHYWCNNPEAVELRPTLERFVRSWPQGVRPKIHYSSPRTEMREIKRKNRKTGKPETVLQQPIWTGHADFLNPFEFITFMRTAYDLEFDVMLEAKSKDLALLRIRRDLARYAPDVATRFGLEPQPLPVDENEPTTDLLEAAAGEDSP
jgi:UV DNA damage endonuclease